MVRTERGGRGGGEISVKVLRHRVEILQSVLERTGNQ